MLGHVVFGWLTDHSSINTMYTNTIPGMHRNKTFTDVKKVRTNKGKQTIGYAACIIWDKVPLNLKKLNIHEFSKQPKTLFTVRTA